MVIGSERHESRRIDNQLRGRCGRQGDPGATLFFLSLEDDLMRLFASDRVSAMLKKFGMDEGVDISHPMVSRSIEKAQKKVEARNFEIRKNLLEYDQVMDSQRKAVYQVRDRVLISDNLMELISDQFEEVLEGYHAGLLEIVDPDKPVSELLSDHVEQRFGVSVSASDLDSDDAVEVVCRRWNEEVINKRDRAGEKDFDRLLHYILLRSLDEKWKDHLHAMDQLRTGVGMRSYAQVDPKLEYKREGFRMFTDMLHQFKEDTSAVISRIRIEKVDESRQQEQLASTWSGRSEGVTADSARQQFESHSQQMDQGVSGSQKTATVETIRNEQPKVGRNSPCPCGSGKKFKKCCGKQ